MVPVEISGFIPYIHHGFYGVSLQQATTSAVMVTPAILRAREVDPLGVSKLVAHEVQIALVFG